MKRDSTHLFTTNRNALCVHCSSAWSCIDFSFCVNSIFLFVETQFFNPFINIENYVCLLVLVAPFLATKRNYIFP